MMQAESVMCLNTSTIQRDGTQCSGQLTMLFCGLIYYFFTKSYIIVLSLSYLYLFVSD